ncbi:MAG TPA: Ppx/GppA phosphatase family protein [Verrucomicrobiae bacterium]
MEKIRRAVVDVGTNSIKLLIADVNGRDVQLVHEASRQTRLGKGFYETQQLQSDAIAHTAEAVAEFAKIAREKKSAAVRVIATSAARDAVNAQELISAIRGAAHLETEIISGAQEAEWVFQGVTTGAEMANQPLLLLDVGGGSTELILGRGGKINFAQSFPLGTVRLLEKFPHSDPPKKFEFDSCHNWLKDFLRREVRPQLEPALKNETGDIQLVGTGGTTNILARMENKLDRFDREKIDGAVLTVDQIVAHRKKLWRSPLAERKEISGLPKSRADVILTGVLICEIIMEKFCFKKICVSTRGLRFAAVMD